jgi:hypothetical protein
MTSARHLDPGSIRLNKLNSLDKGNSLKPQAFVSPGYIVILGTM